MRNPRALRQALTSGPAIAGYVNATAQTIAQLREHEGDWRELNTGAILTAGGLGYIGYGVLMKVAMRFPAPLLVKKAGRWGFANPAVWRNLAAQQFFMCSFTYFLYSTLHLVHNGWTLERIEQALQKGTADNLTFAAIAQLMQGGLATRAGQSWAPKGYGDKRIALLNSLITLAVRSVIQSLGEAAQERDQALPGEQELVELLEQPPSELPPLEDVLRLRVPGMPPMPHGAAGAY